MTSSLTRPAAGRIAPSLRRCSSRIATRSRLRSQGQPLTPFYSQRTRSIAGTQIIQHTHPCSTAIPRYRLNHRVVASCRRSNSTTSAGTSQTVAADDYIQELQDLYEIAQDELEIAAESTGQATIYAASDRATMREAFDDLDRAYAAYTGAPPPSSAAPGATRVGAADTTANAAADVESSGVKLGGGESVSVDGSSVAARGDADGEGEPAKRSTNFDPADISPDVREEIKRRVGQRVREMKQAVEALEESAKEE